MFNILWEPYALAYAYRGPVGARRSLASRVDRGLVLLLLLLGPSVLGSCVLAAAALACGDRAAGEREAPLGLAGR